MKVEIKEWYTVKDVKANPNKLYVFGDNLERKGLGGQAIIRKEPNSYGIATKLKPYSSEDSYMRDIELHKEDIEFDISNLEQLIKANKQYEYLVFPKDGLGTGLAKLDEKAPRLFLHLNSLLTKFGVKYNYELKKLELL